MRDDMVRASLDDLRGEIDISAATTAWKQALDASAWDESPVWVHGDLSSGNLVALDGRLSAVIDFGGAGRRRPRLRPGGRVGPVQR
jgi:aminoglycoside phosphotransferase (APT) family kinase protein